MRIYGFEIDRLTEVVPFTRSVRVGRLTKRLVSAASMLVESRPGSEALIIIKILKSLAIWHSINVIDSQFEWHPQSHSISLTSHMDLFDAAGNVFTILRLAARVLFQFRDVECASTESTWFHTEASEVYSLLKDLGARIEEHRIDTPWTGAIQAIVARDGPLDQFNNISGLLEKISKRGSHLQMASERLIRNFEKDESDGILAQVERLKTLIAIAILKMEQHGITSTDTPESENQKFLVYAAEHEYVGIARFLLGNGVDINAGYGDYGNALQVVSHKGCVHSINFLLEKGADVNAQGGQYGNALEAAIWGGHEHIVELLLENGAVIDKPYGSILPVASSSGHVGIVKILIDRGADVNKHCGLHGNALYAASAGGHEQIVRLLLDKGAKVDAPYGNALQAAASAGHKRIVKMLLDKGADVNADCGIFGGALYSASSGGHKTIVKLLLEKGADVDGPDGMHVSALQVASLQGFKEIVDMLVEKGARIKEKGILASE